MEFTPGCKVEMELEPLEHLMLLKARSTDSLASLVTLLLSGGTLICCALPILLVSLGLGTVVASLTSALP